MLRRVIVLLLCAAVPLSMFGVLMPRDPTPEELKAINKYKLHMNKVLDQFRSAAWEEKIDFGLVQPMVNPNSDRPIDLTEIFQRTYEARKSSARYKTLVVPMVQKAQKQKDQGEKQLQMARVEDLLHIQVRVICNVLVSTLHPGPEKKNAVVVPGAISAYRDEHNPFGYGASYTLLFGSKKAARWDPNAGYYYYHFAHPHDSPNIENIEIRIYGADDRIKQILRTVDWTEVNKALTP